MFSFSLHNPEGACGSSDKASETASQKEADTTIYHKIPGERVQIDTCKIAPGLYQYTAVDDCTRYQILELYLRRTAQNTLDFLEKVVEETPFPVQRVQTDLGREFFAYKVQEWLMDSCIKFRPNPPGAPHLSGKVGSAERTGLEEFYATIDLHDQRLRDTLSE